MLYILHICFNVIFYHSIKCNSMKLQSVCIIMPAAIYRPPTKWRPAHFMQQLCFILSRNRVKLLHTAPYNLRRRPVRLDCLLKSIQTVNIESYLQRSQSSGFFYNIEISATCYNDHAKRYELRCPCVWSIAYSKCEVLTQ